MRVVDLFAGGGGLSLGLKKSGFTLVGAIENWESARAIYAENFRDHPVLNLNLDDVPNATKVIRNWQPDVIVGGPPCQDFSSAGKRDESMGRANLTLSYAQIVAQIKPRYFLMENVARAEKSNAYAQALAVFRQAGYGLTVKVLDASLCGVPQVRKRLVVIGSLNDEDGFLDDALEQKLSKSPMTVRQYLKNKVSFEHYYRHPRSYARRGIFSIDEPSPTIRGVNRPVPKGYPGHVGDACSHTTGVRAMTTLERALIQTFPSTFEWVGTKTDVEQVIGNAVPVNLAKYVGEHLMQHIQDKERIYG